MILPLILILAQFMVPSHTGALANAPSISAPSWDTTSGHSCNPVFTGSTTSYTCTLTASAGEPVFIGYFITANNALTSVTVDGSAASVAINQALAGSFGYQGLYYAANLTAGSHTIAINYSAPVTPIAMYARTVTGAATSPIDGTPTGAVFTVGTGANFACPSMTTTQSNDFIIAWGMSSSTTNISAGSGYTLDAGANLNNGNSGGAYESQTGVTAGSYAPNFTNANGGHQGCIALAVRHP